MNPFLGSRVKIRTCVFHLLRFSLHYTHIHRNNILHFQSQCESHIISMWKQKPNWIVDARESILYVAFILYHLFYCIKYKTNSNSTMLYLFCVVSTSAIFVFCFWSLCCVCIAAIPPSFRYHLFLFSVFSLSGIYYRCRYRSISYANYFFHTHLIRFRSFLVITYNIPCFDTKRHSH